LRETGVFVEFNRDNQVTEAEASQEMVEEIVNRRLARIASKVTTAEIHIGHVKESRTNNPELRCSIEVRPENLNAVAASAEGVGVEAVIRSACDKVLHAYDKVIGKQQAAR
jgi:Ni,Fe-hydrogenase I large subunit